MNKLVNIFLNKITFVIIFLLIQLVILYELVLYFYDNFAYVYLIIEVVSLLSILYLVNKQRIVSEIKIAWIACIMLLPVFGVTLYFLLGRPSLNKKYRQKLNRIETQFIKYMPQDPRIENQLKEEDSLASTQSYYIYHTSHYPVYNHTSTEYLGLGEIKLEALKKELRKAKHYIFIQYFIITTGKMWNEILEILEEKVANGVQVRVMYDDAGCISTLPFRYDKILKKKGIPCVIINPLRPALNIVLQNRDHRKMVVIDGIVGFTGGINIGDEYINAYERFGHWKDCAILLKGDAVRALVITFLETWNFYSNEELTILPYLDYAASSVKEMNIEKESIREDDMGNNTEFNKETGFVQPYSDTPLDETYISQRVYLNIFNQAKEYVYVNTPYFIMDQAFVDEVVGAANRGVDVRIVMPHHPDKWYVHMMTRSYYKELITSGVRVYEYTPGFIHSKTFVSDDTIGTIGTVNLDYRSMYHNFECGVWMYKTTAVTQLRDDFLSTLKLCKKITLEDCDTVKWYGKVFLFFTKIFAPLL